MSTVPELLRVGNGSFAEAEKLCAHAIKQGVDSAWLDMAILHFSWGKHAEWKKDLMHYREHFPNCPRLSYNDGYRRMYDGDLEGLVQFIESGRQVGAFGNWKIPEMRCPRWDGKADLQGKTIVLWGEGGQGDQVIGLRAAAWLKEKGARVVAGVSDTLIDLANHCTGVDLSVQREGAHLVAHDFYLQGMSAPYVLERTWETLWSGPYIAPWKKEAKSVELWDRVIPRTSAMQIGLRWRGNPGYDEDILRWFPPELMLGLAEIPGFDFYSLQKEDSQPLPANVTDLEPLLSTWACTVEAISRLDLVITACTSVAHVAAAMGKPTWVLVPVAAYYPWAQPINQSQWYPSVRLFRQKKYGEWADVFASVRLALQNSPVRTLCP